jgi:hypothetical protein
MWPNEKVYSSLQKQYEYLIPVNFNHNLYLSLYPDLIFFGIKTENQAKQHYLIFGRNENRICLIPNDFDPEEYRSLNKDLEHLSNQDLFIHYTKNGYYEHRLFNTSKIGNIFDQDFYQKYYRTKSGLSEYLEHGIKEGRFYNSLIVDNNFDYGFYISYYNHFINSMDFKNVWDQFDAIDHYSKHISNLPNNITKYSTESKIDTTNGICLYVGHLSSNEDIILTLESISNILNHFKQTIIQLSFLDENTKKAFRKQYKLQKYKNTLFLIDNENIGYDFGKYKNIYKKYKELIKKYDYVCHINNSIVIYNDKIAKDSIDKFSKSNCGLYSLTDCYLRNNLTNRNLYHLQSFYLLLSNQYIDKFYQYIISQNKTLLKNNKNEIVKDLEIGLSGHFIKNNIKIGTYCPLTKNKEMLWHNIMSFDPSLDLPYLEYNNLSIAKRQSIKSQTDSLFWLKFKQNMILSHDNKTNIKKIENIKDVLGIDLTSYKIALCCHIYDEYFYEEIKTYIDKLKNSGLNIKYYITTNTKDTVIDNSILVKNKGADLGPFVFLSDTIPKDTDYFIKIHAKTHHGFRKYAISEIINNIHSNLAKLITQNGLYALGSNRYILTMDKFNTETINNFYSRYNLSNIDESKIKFISGTMMIGNYKKYIDICDRIGINFNEEYNLMEDGYKKNTVATNTHAWERILSGIIPYIGNMRVCGI